MSDPAPKSPLFPLLTAVVAVAAVGCLIALLLPAVSQVIYAKHARMGFALIESLSQRRPNTASPAEWENAIEWGRTAFGNVCYSEEHVSLAELKQFNEDLRVRLQGNVDLKTIDWIWQRLAATGPHGAQYVAKFEPDYRRELAYIKAVSVNPSPNPSP